MTSKTMLRMLRSYLREGIEKTWSDKDLYEWLSWAQDDVLLWVIELDQGYEEEEYAGISYVSGTQEYALPSDPDTLRIKFVERTDLASKKTLYPIDKTKRNIRQTLEKTTGELSTDEFYYLTGNKIGIVPKPTTAATNNLTITLVRRKPDITSSVDCALDAIVHKMVVLYATLNAGVKGDINVNNIGSLIEIQKELAGNALSSRQVQESREVNYIEED